MSHPARQLPVVSGALAGPSHVSCLAAALILKKVEIAATDPVIKLNPKMMISTGIETNVTSEATPNPRAVTSEYTSNEVHIKFLGQGDEFFV